VNYVTLIKDIAKHRSVSRFDRTQDQYPGPDFNTLDERVQSAFHEFLGQFGVNEELALFVEHVSLEKEQKLYMRWLDTISTFVGKD
jgi:complement component 1 Q subcomponent-binding protein